jgi:hypothetical protein
MVGFYSSMAQDVISLCTSITVSQCNFLPYGIYHGVRNVVSCCIFSLHNFLQFWRKVENEKVLLLLLVTVLEMRHYCVLPLLSPLWQCHYDDARHMTRASFYKFFFVRFFEDGCQN